MFLRHFERLVSNRYIEFIVISVFFVLSGTFSSQFNSLSERRFEISNRICLCDWKFVKSNFRPTFAFSYYSWFIFLQKKQRDM